MADITKFNNNDLDMNRYFYLLWVLFISVLSCTLLNSCTEQDIELIPVESVILNISSMELTEGESKQIYATILPQNASNKNVIWTSSNSSVATVYDGVITALNAGKAIISVATEDSGKTAICEVVVVAKIYNVESVTLDRTSVELWEGEEITLLPSVMPENASNKDVVWSSSDEMIATVEEGKVTTIKEGEVIVTVTTVDGNKTATCKLTVINDPMTDPIVFADPIIEGMCLDAFDTNNDGELSYKEAASVTDLTKMQLTNPGFKSFDEFQYFTSVKEIPENYFYDAAYLQSIIMPNGLELISGSAFCGCGALINLSIPASVKKIGDSAFSGCSNLISVIIPDSVDFLGEFAFGHCIKLEDIIMSSNLTRIEQYTFSNCINLRNVILPNRLESIGPYAFYSCKSLQNIILPNSLKIIGEDNGVDSGGVFSGCTALESIIIPANVVYMGKGSFIACSSLSEVVILGELNSLNPLMFSACVNLTSIVLPKSLRVIEYKVFNDCRKLKKVHVADIKSWLKVTFGGPQYEEETHPCSNHPMQYGADLYVSGEKITHLIIPDGVTIVPEYVFYNCTSVKSLVIPESIENISSYAFQCPNLTDIYCRAQTPPTLGDGVFPFYSIIDKFEFTKFYVPYQSLDMYKEAERWSNYYNNGINIGADPSTYFFGYDFDMGIIVGS